MQIDAAVHPPLLFDLADAQGADFACAGHVGAAAGLDVDRFVVVPDPDQADAPGPARRLDRQRLDQCGVCLQLRFGDPVFGPLVVLRPMFL